MDYTNLERLKEALANEEKFLFDMSIWNSEINSPNKCGTICCIGGLAEALELGDNDPSTIATSAFSGSERACSWLGIPYNIGEALFYPYQIDDHLWTHITRKQAMGALQIVTAGLKNHRDFGTIEEDIQDYWRSLNPSIVAEFGGEYDE